MPRCGVGGALGARIVAHLEVRGAGWTFTSPGRRTGCCLMARHEWKEEAHEPRALVVDH